MKKRRRRKVEPEKKPGRSRKRVQATPRRRRRRRLPGVVFRITEATSAENGGAEAYRRKALFEQLREIIEEHPGDTPVSVHIVFPKHILSSSSLRTKVVIPTGLKIARTSEAREKISRLESKVVRVFGWVA